jgi:hypothetical protein
MADVEVLAGLAAMSECALAHRMHAARAAGSLPFGPEGGVLSARGWSVGWARRLARTGDLASQHPPLHAAWSAGLISSEHLDPIARSADHFSSAELTALIEQLAPHWGHLSPPAVARFVRAADRMLHPPPDPGSAELDAYEARTLGFSVSGDTVLLSAELPRIEGELVIAAIDALAERLRSTADHVPAGARRADALVQLVNEAAARGALPTRGGLPVAVTVTVEQTRAGDLVACTDRGHLLTEAERGWASCDATVTPVLVRPGAAPCTRPTGLPQPPAPAVDCSRAASRAGHSPRSSDRLSALAERLLGTAQPLLVGRTQRTATSAQRRALAIRDRGCVIPGCGVPAHACQVHHLVEWAAGGGTDLPSLVLLCWSHHRQVDLRMWAIEPAQDEAHPPPQPPSSSGGRPGLSWPANNHAPFTIVRMPRSRWRT